MTGPEPLDRSNGRRVDLLVEELTPASDPVRAASVLARLPYRVLLDSAARGATLGRYSFLAADPPVVVRSKGRNTECLTLRDGACRQFNVNAPTAVRELLAPYQTSPIAGLPPFQCGAAGYIGYDWGATLERLPAPRYDDLGIPDVVLGLYDWVIAWDHAADRAWIMASGFPELGAAGRQRAAGRLASVRQALADPRQVTAAEARGVPATRLVSRSAAAPSFPMTDVDGADAIRLRSSFTRTAYREAGRPRARVHPRRRHLPGQHCSGSRHRSPKRRGVSTAASVPSTLRRSPPTSTSAR